MSQTPIKSRANKKRKRFSVSQQESTTTPIRSRRHKITSQTKRTQIDQENIPLTKLQQAQTVVDKISEKCKESTPQTLKENSILSVLSKDTLETVLNAQQQFKQNQKVNEEINRIRMLKLLPNCSDLLIQ